MARTGMTALLEELRGLVEAGSAEYTIGTTLYWSDNALQDVLDLHRNDLIHHELTPRPVVGTSGTSIYYDYLANYGFFETTTAGSTIFSLQNGGGTLLGTALWSADYRRGIVTFASDALGSAVFLTGRSYDLHASAAEIWRKKAAHYAPTSFNFSTDNHSISREQVYQHCLEMSRYFEGVSQDSIQSTSLYRSDM